MLLDLMMPAVNVNGRCDVFDLEVDSVVSSDRFDCMYNESASIADSVDPVDCVLSSWSNDGECSVTCGSGTRSQTRSIITPAADGGAECGSTSRTISCSSGACPVTPVEQCSESKFGINFCDDWCNTPGRWGCGTSTMLATDGRNTDDIDYTCSCSECNGCNIEDSDISLTLIATTVAVEESCMELNADACDIGCDLLKSTVLSDTDGTPCPTYQCLAGDGTCPDCYNHYAPQVAGSEIDVKRSNIGEDDNLAHIYLDWPRYFFDETVEFASGGDAMFEHNGAHGGWSYTHGYNCVDSVYQAFTYQQLRDKGLHVHEGKARFSLDISWNEVIELTGNQTIFGSEIIRHRSESVLFEIDLPTSYVIPMTLNTLTSSSHDEVSSLNVVWVLTAVAQELRGDVPVVEMTFGTVTNAPWSLTYLDTRGADVFSVISEYPLQESRACVYQDTSMTCQTWSIAFETQLDCTGGDQTRAVEVVFNANAVDADTGDVLESMERIVPFLISGSSAFACAEDIGSFLLSHTLYYKYTEDSAWIAEGSSTVEPDKGIDFRVDFSSGATISSVNMIDLTIQTSELISPTVICTGCPVTVLASDYVYQYVFSYTFFSTMYPTGSYSLMLSFEVEYEGSDRRELRRLLIDASGSRGAQVGFSIDIGSPIENAVIVHQIVATVDAVGVDEENKDEVCTAFAMELGGIVEACEIILRVTVRRSLVKSRDSTALRITITEVEDIASAEEALAKSTFVQTLVKNQIIPPEVVLTDIEYEVKSVIVESTDVTNESGSMKTNDSMDEFELIFYAMVGLIVLLVTGLGCRFYLVSLYYMRNPIIPGLQKRNPGRIQLSQSEDDLSMSRVSNSCYPDESEDGSMRLEGYFVNPEILKYRGNDEMLIE